MYFTLTCILFLLTVWYIKRRQFLKNIENVPCVAGWVPLVGHYFLLKNREANLEISLYSHRIHGKTMLLFAGFEPAIFTVDTNLLEIILGSPHYATKKSPDYKFLQRWFGDGLLTSTGKKWSTHRKILTPAFHYNSLEDFVNVFEKKGVFLINNLKKELGKSEFDVTNPITLYTLDVICETAMGTSVDAQNNPNHEYIQAVKIYCEAISERPMSPVARFEFIYKLMPGYRKEVKAVKILKKFSSEIIANRRKAINQEDKENSVEKRNSTFVDILLKSTIDGEFLNDEEIREEVDTFLFEGHDTTAIALSMILYNLSKYPEVQSKAFEEIKTVIGDDNSKPAKIEDLNQLKYLEMVIKESLRLYPSVSIHGRTLLKDLKYKNFVLPKGLNVGFSQYALHRDPEVYPDPQMFLPERFTLENQAKRHPYAYIPFSAGPRNCIGQKFAMLELKSAVSKILRNFEVFPATPFFEPIFYSVVTTQSANGVNISLKERKW